MLNYNEQPIIENVFTKKKSYGNQQQNKMIFECQSALTLHRVRTALYMGCFQVFPLSAVQNLDWLLLHKLETMKK